MTSANSGYKAQTKADPAADASTLFEALKYALYIACSDTAPLVGYAKDHVSTVGIQLDHYHAPLAAVLQSIVDQVNQRPLHQATIAAEPDRLLAVGYFQFDASFFCRMEELSHRVVDQRARVTLINAHEFIVLELRQLNKILGIRQVFFDIFLNLIKQQHIVLTRLHSLGAFDKGKY